jgi:hypothetical protein
MSFEGNADGQPIHAKAQQPTGQGKLPASWLAAVLLNLVTGVATLKDGKIAITGQNLVDLGLYGTMFLNILYFYYVEAFTETHPAEQARLAQVPILEWYLRVANQILLSALWIFLDKKLMLFLGGLLLFYLLLLLWDFIVSLPSLLKKDRGSIPGFVGYDFAGFCLTIVFIGALIVERAHMGDNFYMLPGPIVTIIQQTPESVHDFAMIIAGICTAGYGVLFYISRRDMKQRGFGLREMLRHREQLV